VRPSGESVAAIGESSKRCQQNGPDRWPESKVAIQYHIIVGKQGHASLKGLMLI